MDSVYDIHIAILLNPWKQSFPWLSTFLDLVLALLENRSFQVTWILWNTWKCMGLTFLFLFTHFYCVCVTELVVDRCLDTAHVSLPDTAHSSWGIYSPPYGIIPSLTQTCSWLSFKMEKWQRMVSGTMSMCVAWTFYTYSKVDVIVLIPDSSWLLTCRQTNHLISLVQQSECFASPHNKCL